MSAAEVRKIVHPGTGGNRNVAVGGVDGLLLQVTPTEARSWLLRATVKGKRRQIGLGSYPDVTLAQARERARSVKDMIWQGIDPLAEKRRLTFAQAMEKTLEARTAEFKNEKHKKQWRSTLETYAVPVLDSMAVSDIGVSDVLRVLEPIWTTKTETASRLRGRIEVVLSWATVGGHRTGDNPARWRGNLDAVLPKPGKVAKVKHNPALSLADAADWFSDLRNREGMATRALEFVALTAARSGEVRGATWTEIDLDTAMWVIPAERMKAGREHRVPLTAEAVALLKALPRMKGSDYVFPAARGGALSDMALSACMKRINEARDDGYIDPRSGRPAVPHGLRSTFRDWTAECTEFERDIAEIALAHNVGSTVERAYRRGDMIEKRRQMMAAWARFLKGEAGTKIVQMGAVR
ncbi:putative P4-family integrase [Roseobacter sp. AzwK-3b]|uniref:tyrosine-type recombinase/integrase n=1 Tax=Roseobacter sp. AzwK-3b TaxID=351016 RepID=UPI0001568AD2|nr:site-specific integrase [Roseobacter sp. AzwK-3b]EDM71520.1 putative P4-family integrase [Roseobacter sp. AzwK-3b]